MSPSNDFDRRRLLCGVSLAVLALMFAIDPFLAFAVGSPSGMGSIAAIGFAMPLLMACLVGAVFAITQLLRGTADRTGLLGGALVVMGWTAGVRIIELRQLDSALQSGIAGVPPDVLERLFAAAPILWRSIVPSGILFPIGFAILGVAIVVTAPIPRWIGAVMVAAAVLFPNGRIGGLVWAIRAADAALAASFALLAWQILSRPEAWQRADATRSESPGAFVAAAV